ncbi:porin [Ehrlichia sp. JZT12]
MSTIAYLLTINQVCANNVSASGTLKLQYGINDKYLTRLALSAASSLLYSHNINNYITVGSFIKLSTVMMSNGVNPNGHFKPDILDVKANPNAAYLFLKSPKAGSIEIGLTDPVTQSMKISSSDISVASGGIGGTWLNYTSLKDKIIFCPDLSLSLSDYNEVHGISFCFKPNPKLIENDVSLETYHYGYEVNSYGSHADDTIWSRPTLYTTYHGLSASIPVISYYIPKFKGIEVGFSYIPKINDEGFTIYNNVVAGGIKYQNKLFNIHYTLSGVAEYGTLNRSNNKLNKELDLHKYNDIMSYSIGILLNYQNIITFVGSYGSLGKSGIGTFRIYPNVSGSPIVDEISDNEFYDLGIKFTTSNNYNIGLTYFYNNKDVTITIDVDETKDQHDYVSVYNNKDVIGKKTQNKHSLSVYTLGLEKSLPNKISIYSDITYFTVDKSPIPDGNYSGYVVLVGTKYSF